MKFDVRYEVVFEVTREVDIDDEDLRDFAERYRYKGNLIRAAEHWLRWQDTEYLSRVFADWKTDEPLPDDFEFQCLDIQEAIMKVRD